MAKYLDKNLLLELDKYRREIFALRTEAYSKFSIDVLDNDTLSALSIYEIVSQYDPDYNINFARNGEDAKSGGVLIEQKASRIEKKKRTKTYGYAGFQFHAMGNIEYDRYIFVTRDRSTLNIIRIYDISESQNATKISSYLLNERNKWLERGRKDEKKMKHDVIILPEELLATFDSNKTNISNCEVIRA